MTNETLLKEKIRSYAFGFTRKMRGDKYITVFEDNVPKELRDSVHKAHSDRMPSDWIYEKYSSILDALTNYEIESMDDIEENRAEIVDGLVDVYTSDLTAWLHADNRNVYYLTEAQEEYGAESDGFKLLAMAQYKAIDDVFSEVVELLGTDDAPQAEGTVSAECKLVVKSLHDAQAECEGCGWHYAFTGERTKEELTKVWEESHKKELKK
jgi:hypothetical protein